MSRNAASPACTGDDGDCCSWVPQSAASGSSSSGSCQHCGSPVDAGEAFCGQGCAYAHRVLHERKWEKFYNIRDRVISPVGETAFASDSFAWMREAAQSAEAAAAATSEGRGAELTLALQGASCAACVWLISKVYADHCTSGRIDVDLHAGRLYLHWQPGALDAVSFARAMQGFGYNAGPLSATEAAGKRVPQSRVMLRRIGLCAAFQMNVMLYTLPVYFGMEADFTYAWLFSTMSMLFGTLSVWFGGSYFIRRAWEVIRKGGLSIDLPLSLGIIGSYVGSMAGWVMQAEQYIYFDFVSSFILLMLVGRWAKEVTLERNRKRLSGLQPVAETLRRLDAPADGMFTAETPAGSAQPLAGGQENLGAVAPFADGQTHAGGAAPFAGDSPPAAAARETLILREQLLSGDRFIVGSAQRVPVECVLQSTSAEFDLAWVNGEPQPQIFYAGQRVPAGARYVGLGEVTLAAREAWADSLMAQLLQKPPQQTFRNRMIEAVVRGYLIGILAVALVAGIVWLFAAGWWQAGAIVTAVLVVSCPCALGLAVPLADELAIVALRRAGVFVRSGDLWERLAQVRRVVFDKTGTLTFEMPHLSNPQALDALDERAAAALAALVQENPHPVARSLHRALLVHGAPAPLAGAVREAVGCGVSLGGWSLGKEGWQPEQNPAGEAQTFTDRECGQRLTASAATVLAFEGREVARFVFSESVRSDARRQVAALRERGYACEILSGDSQAKVDAMSAALGLPQAAGAGGLSPQQKAERMSAPDAAPALMVGDGANDSLAFDRALCRGTPVVYRGILERKSDFYYMGQGIAGIGALFDVNAARKRTEIALIAFMVVYNILSVGAAVLGWINPLIAAILMPVSSLATLGIVAVGMRRVWRIRV